MVDQFPGTLAWSKPVFNSMRFFLVFMVFAAVAAASAQRFVKAQLIFFRSNDMKTAYNPPRQVVITVQAELDKLTKFLPGLGFSEGGLKPGGWAGWVTIRLIRAKGPGIQIFVPPSAKVYSMVAKHGDFPAGKGFKEFLLELEKKGAPGG
jgi:hypothetical protein